MYPGPPAQPAAGLLNATDQKLVESIRVQVDALSVERSVPVGATATIVGVSAPGIYAAPKIEPPRLL